MIQFTLTPPPITTKISIGSQILDNLLIHRGRPIALIGDRAVAKTARTLASSLNAPLTILPGGEKIKERKYRQKIEETLFSHHFGRDALLIAMGGGALLDLAGFTASTYMRSISTIYLPTTLLAMVDASIGGKTAINTKEGKNLLGTLHHPEEIVIDTQFLKTLPPSEYLNGIAEMLKLALVWDRELWERLTGGEKPEALIQRAVEGKVSIVEKDPCELNLRRILNFGHTLGHAIEKVSGYQIPHGQAVAIGSVLESRLSALQGYLERSDLLEIEKRYAQFGYPSPSLSINSDLWEALKMDKKRVKNSTRFVQIEKIGKAAPFDGSYCTEISEKILLNL